MLLRLLLLLAVPAWAATLGPLAPPLFFSVEKNGFVELTLRGYSANGRAMKAYITSLPASGKLYQLSQPYSKYGTAPVHYEASDEITSASAASPVLVTGTRNRLIYVAPPNAPEPNGAWAFFKYKVVDNSPASSSLATVQLHPPSKVLVGSDFSTSTDDWVVKDNSANAADVSYEESRQGPLNFFLHTTDDEIDIRRDTRTDDTSDAKMWRFCAPIKFHGNYEVAYGGTLQYTLGSFAGDFSRLNTNRDSVVLTCKTCNEGYGMRFVQKDIPFDGRATTFTHVLTEASAHGWLKDPKNELTTVWSPPSQCEMVEMLSSIHELCILGDHTKWYESVGLDNVQIKAPSKNGKIPVGCLCANPGTQCA